MTCRPLLPVAVLFLAAAAGCAPNARDSGTPAEQAAVAAAVAPSLVRVEYTLRYDKGEEPPAGDAAEQERPLELEGFLVSPTQVVSADPLIHPRFVESVAVRRGDEVVKARTAAYFKTQDAVLLELERPLQGAKPLVFNRKAKPPYLAVTYHEQEGAWTIDVQGYSAESLVDEWGHRFASAPPHALITDQAGQVAFLVMNWRFASEEDPAVHPLQWPAYTAAEHEAMIAGLEKRCNQAIVRVTLHFRSPSKESGGRFRSREEGEEATEAHVAGVLLEGNRVLVLANLRPKVTARLERIVVHPAEGEDVGAKFTCTLKDYGCLVATLEKPLAGGVPFSEAPLRDARYVLLPAADIRVQGENRTAYFNHCRIRGFERGWRRHVFPQVTGKGEELFLFEPQGALVALPMARREKVSADERHYSPANPVLTSAGYLKAVLDNVAANSDPHNVPLTEDQELRLAWLGVELQGLNKELARANKVADLTRDGETGALVSYVYPDSPAARAGIEPGFLLLRLRVEGQPKPLEIQLEEDERGPFPWDLLDEVGDQDFDRIPTPWPSAENPFTRALTDLGFGKKFQAEFFHDGKALTKSFEVAASPPHYDSAPKYKSAALGLTVRNLTYEVRRYLQREDGEPGVIISKIESGSKAAVAGVKPFEVVTHVNDKPVMNVKDFEGAVGKATGELRLSIKRMAKGRVVKINMAAATDEMKP